MSDATATILQSYGKPYEFGLLDRKVFICYTHASFDCCYCVLANAGAATAQSSFHVAEIGLLKHTVVAIVSYAVVVQVVVCTENDVDEQNDPSLYSLVRVSAHRAFELIDG